VVLGFPGLSQFHNSDGGGDSHLDASAEFVPIRFGRLAMEALGPPLPSNSKYPTPVRLD